jgi:hypothetical protein
MSNQRPAKLQRAAMPMNEGNVPLKLIIEFAESAERELENAGEEDAAYYFGQLAEHLRTKPHVGLNEKTHRILGL